MKKALFILSLLILPGFVSAQGVAVECTDIGVTMRYGSKDAQAEGNVYLLQQFLNSVGYNSGFPDGKFGLKTKTAVAAFQSAKKLTPDGIAGPNTRAVIKQSSCKDYPIENITSNSVAPNSPTTPGPASQPEIKQDSVQDVILTEGTVSSLRVRTDGVVSVGNSFVTMAGTITAGARASTERWFEVTKNPSVYKLSETTITLPTYQRSNIRFEEVVSGLESNTTYYFRACAGNDDLGQRTCGSTTSIKTSN